MNRLDISGLVRADGENVLRWTPRSSNNFKASNNQPAPQIALSWMP
jgi:hypothetical protein